MKKLNITKEQFNRSRYFKNKYGTLEYVSESGKTFKTSKGQILKFNEARLPDLDKVVNREIQKIGDAFSDKLGELGFRVSVCDDMGGEYVIRVDDRNGYGCEITLTSDSYEPDEDLM